MASRTRHAGLEASVHGRSKAFTAPPPISVTSTTSTETTAPDGITAARSATVSSNGTSGAALCHHANGMSRNGRSRCHHAGVSVTTGSAIASTSTKASLAVNTAAGASGSVTQLGRPSLGISARNAP
jgi:hypothetical protein